MHIPTSFSQKKCMLFEPRNQHANWIFFELRKKKLACIYQYHSHKKTACYSNQEINMQTGFFPVFLLRKTACIYQHHSHKKKTACYSNQEINMQTGFFFPIFQLRKTTCIYQHHSHKKIACYSNQEINMQIGYFSSFPTQKKKKKKRQHAYTNIILTKKLHVIQTKKLTCKLDFFQFSSSEKQHVYTNIILTKKLHVI